MEPSLLDEPLPLDSSTNTCSLLPTCDMLIETSEGLLCSICYEMCSKAKNPNLNTIRSPKGKLQKCSCTHNNTKEDDVFFENLFLDYFELYAKEKELDLTKAIVLNQLLHHKVKDIAILEYFQVEVTEFFKKDLENLEKQTFKWEDIEIPKIEKRATFIKQFNIKIPAIRLSLLYTEPFEKLVSLKYLDKLTETPNYTFGQPIYNNSLNFYTYLLRYFIDFYLKKDFVFLEKIDAEDIETYTPIARHYIRENNKEDAFLRKKYFNEEFNLVTFAVKLIEKFVVGATWRWIGGNHKAHIYSVEISKMIIECGIANQDECNQIRNALYLKVQVYRSLEDIVQKDSATIAKNWIDVWTDGLVLVREYYIEILINTLYLHQDVENLDMMLKAYKDNKKQTIKSEEQLKNIIHFNKSILFEDEFARKTMDFLLSYILSQNKIMERILSSTKIENIADNFLHIFSNYDDPYLHTLKLMREEDYINFAKEINKEFGPNTYIKQDFMALADSLKNILAKLANGYYLYNDSLLLKEVEEFMDALNVKVNYLKSIQLNEPKNFIFQRILFASRIPSMLFNLFSNIMQFSDIIKPKENEILLAKFKAFFEFYMKDNHEVQSSFYRKEIFSEMEHMFYKFPGTMSTFIHDSFKENPQILVSKDYLLTSLLDMLKKHYDSLKTNAKTIDYKDLSQTIDILALFINIPCYKIFNWIPEYDLWIAKALTLYDDFFDLKELENLLMASEAVENLKENEIKLEFLMNFLSLLQISISYRYSDAIYQILDARLPIDGLQQLIKCCKKNINYKTVFLELYGNIHIDFKNHLIDKRSNYYFTKPLDLQYEEDPFFDKFYDKTIDLLINELKLMIDESETLKAHNSTEIFSNYINNVVIANLVKLINYFLVIKEGDVAIKLKKYITKLEELNDFIFTNRFILLSLLGVGEMEFESPERKNIDIELKKVDQNLEIKRQRIQVVGHCKAILEMCKKIMHHAPIAQNKRCLISDKSNVSRAAETYLKTLNFSNRLAIRKNNLTLPFDKLLKIKNKKGDGKIEITKAMATFYLAFKHLKMSVDMEKNSYIRNLREETTEMKIQATNLCAFFHNQLMKEWPVDEKNKKYTLIESLCNALFISTSSIQKSLYEVLQTQNEQSTVFIDSVWVEMKYTMSYVKFKTNIDHLWKEAFRRTMLLLRFHQFMCEDNFIPFKVLFGEKKLPSDTIDRVQRWTTIFQKMSDNCQWHYNYTKGDIDDFDLSHRNYLLPLATGVFENLAEVCTGPCTENQQKIYTFIYDRYNGFLRRFWRDPNTEFYKTKLALLDFILAMAEGNDPKIINYQTTNFELVTLNQVMINSIKQLYYCIGKKDPFTGKKMSEYPFTFKDYDHILLYFQSNKDFASHTLLKIALKIFSYIKMMGAVKSKYVMFCKERDDLLVKYQRGEEDFRNIAEEDLVTYKFLNRVLIKIEIVRDDDSETLVPFYFEVFSKCLYLSAESKKDFMDNVDRTSQDTKISGLLTNSEFFKIEMENNERRFMKYYLIYKTLGGGNTYYLELLCLVISFIMNILLLVGLENNFDDYLYFAPSYYNTILVLGLIEIGLSVIGILGYMFLSYTLQKKIALEKFLKTHAYKKDRLTKFDHWYLNYWVSFATKKDILVFVYHIIMVSLGISRVSYGFFGLDLFALIFLIPSMQYVVQSVTEHYQHILSTLALVALVIYAYSIFVHLYFINYFANGGMCNNLSECYWTILDIGFRNGEGVGGLLNMAYYGFGGGDIRFYGSLFLNISFFLIVNTVLLNIILAVLVDTFSQLRQRSDDFEDDSENVCFICGIEKFKFEKSGIDFDKHISIDHDVWSYVYFLIFMSEKTAKDCNGIEDELWHKIHRGDTSWMPIHRSINYEKFNEPQKNHNVNTIIEQTRDNTKEILNVLKAKFNVPA